MTSNEGVAQAMQNLPTGSEQMQDLRQEFSGLRGFIDAGKRMVGRTALALSLAAGLGIAAGIGEDMINPTAAFAQTGGYPDWEKPCLEGVNKGKTTGTGYWCPNYNWGDLDTANSNSSRGYGYRNCTDWVAYRIGQLTGTPLARGLGNAQDWDNNAPSGYAVDNSPEVGDIAVWEVPPGQSYGHVAVVEAVNSDGTVNVSEYNKKRDGVYGTRANLRADHYIDVNGSNSSSTPSKARPVNGKADFDHDGHSDFVTRNGDTWTVRGQGGNGIVEGLRRGSASAIPLVGDINGDGYGDFITYDNGSWMAWNGRAPYDIASQGVRLGGANSTPLVGDITGDGVAEFVTFSNGQWDAMSGGGQPITLGFNIGGANSIPLLGDVSGDGKADFIAYDGGAWAAWQATGANQPIFQGKRFGGPASIPMVGNVNGQGTADLVIREGNTWYARNTDLTPISQRIVLGTSTSQPFLADIDGNGKADFVTFDQTTGNWSAWDATGSNNPVSSGVNSGAGGTGMAG